MRIVLVWQQKDPRRTDLSPQRIGARLLGVLKASVIRRLVIGVLLFAGVRALLKGLGIWP